MSAIVTVPFQGVPDGMVYPRDYAVGDVVTGDLAALAIREGWAEATASGAPAAPSEGSDGAPDGSASAESTENPLT